MKISGLFFAFCHFGLKTICLEQPENSTVVVLIVVIDVIIKELTKYVITYFEKGINQLWRKRGPWMCDFDYYSLKYEWCSLLSNDSGKLVRSLLRIVSYWHNIHLNIKTNWIGFSLFSFHGIEQSLIWGMPGINVGQPDLHVVTSENQH